MEENWNDIIVKLKQKFIILTDDDLLLDDDSLLLEGKHNEMLYRLQVKLCKTKEEVHKLISALKSEIGSVEAREIMIVGRENRR